MQGGEGLKISCWIDRQQSLLPLRINNGLKEKDFKKSQTIYQYVPQHQNDANQVLF
jgi:hypothetical protein